MKITVATVTMNITVVVLHPIESWIGQSLILWQLWGWEEKKSGSGRNMDSWLARNHCGEKSEIWTSGSDKNGFLSTCLSRVLRKIFMEISEQDSAIASTIVSSKLKCTDKANKMIWSNFQSIYQNTEIRNTNQGMETSKETDVTASPLLQPLKRHLRWM